MKNYLTTLFLSILFPQILFSQVFLEQKIGNEENFLRQNRQPLRQFVSLNGSWQYLFGPSADGKENEWRNLNIPFVVDDLNELVLRKKFNVSGNSDIGFHQLIFTGVTGLKEVYINESRIPFDPSDIEQYSFDIPSKILKDNRDNWLKVVLHRESIIEYQNLLASKLYLADRKIGIYGSVYIATLPPTFISDIEIIPSFSSNYNSANLEIKTEFVRFENKIDKADSSAFSYQISLWNLGMISPVESDNIYFQLKENSTVVLNSEIILNNPVLWTPKNPNLYQVKIKLFHKTQLIDELNFDLGLKDFKFFKNNFFLNGINYPLKGITYFESNGIKNSLFSPTEIESDVSLMKSLGANAVRVINSLPSKRFIEECDKQGLLVFIDCESKIYPTDFYSHEELYKLSKSKIHFIRKNYSNHVSFSGINLGTLRDESQEDFFNELVKAFKNASFPAPKESLREGMHSHNLVTLVNLANGFIPQNISVDVFGIDLTSLNSREVMNEIKILRQKELNFIVSSIGYKHNFGVVDGYSDPYSIQAQAKFLSTAIETLNKDTISYFVHTFADYRLPYESITAGTIDNKLMGFGLLNEYRNKKKLSFEVVGSYFKDEKLPTIIQGNYSDNKNVIFVFFGIGLITLLVVLINSTRRFREYTTRALLKTYNFFSDIRDERIFSSFHITLLALISTFSISLLYSGILYSLRDRLDLERFVSIFNCLYLFKIVSYLAWRPVLSIIYLGLFFLIVIIFISLIIKFFNLFVRSKIYFSHAYSITVWSTFPFVISIPLGVISYKVLSYHEYNIFVYALALLFHVWILLRILKGVSIVFDVRKSNVNIVFALLFLLVIVSSSIYLELTNSTFQYFEFFFIN